MGKRATSIRHIIDPVRHLLTSSEKFLRTIDKFPLQENWVTRFLAFWLDYILLFIVTGLAKDLIFPPWAFSALDYILLAGLMSFFYFIAAETVFGYNLGKRLFDLKVVTVNGDKPSFKNVVIRNISKIFFIFLIVDVIGSYFTANALHQRYAEKIAHTTVKNGKTF
jgi:uncharacterized RDD family membrane protein YckC